MIEAIATWMGQVFEVLGAAKELSPWVYLLVVVGGVASAVSPCYVPVLAMFGGYVGGYAKSNTRGGLGLALPFVLGNAVILAAVGAVASFIGSSALQVFTGYQLDRWIPGIIGLAMGLQILGVLRLKIPVMPIFRWTQRQPGNAGSAFVLGLPFGLVVTPCTIPIFFAIVTFVALQASVLHGALLMVAYAIGRGLILTTVAVSVSALKAFDIARSSVYLERASGVLILAVSIGLLLFYDAYAQFTASWNSSASVTGVVLRQETAQTHMGRGMVLAIDPNRAKITLKHEEIRNFMPPMTMEFSVEPSAMLNDLRVEDQVHFTLAVYGGDFIITRIGREK